MSRMPRRPNIIEPSALQLKTLRKIAHAGARLRRHSSIVPLDPKLAGRSEVVSPGTNMHGALLPSYTARQLLKAGYIEVMDEDVYHRHTDFCLSDYGRRVVDAYAPKRKKHNGEGSERP